MLGSSPESPGQELLAKLKINRHFAFFLKLALFCLVLFAFGGILTAVLNRAEMVSYETQLPQHALTNVEMHLRRADISVTQDKSIVEPVIRHSASMTYSQGPQGLFFVSQKSKRRGTLEILLPVEETLNSLTIDSSHSVTLTIRGVTANIVGVDTDLIVTDVSNSTFNEFYVEADNGKIEISGSTSQRTRLSIDEGVVALQQLDSPRMKTRTSSADVFIDVTKQFSCFMGLNSDRGFVDDQSTSHTIDTQCYWDIFSRFGDIIVAPPGSSVQHLAKNSRVEFSEL